MKIIKIFTSIYDKNNYTAKSQIDQLTSRIINVYKFWNIKTLLF